MNTILGFGNGGAIKVASLYKLDLRVGCYFRFCAYEIEIIFDRTINRVIVGT